MMALPMSRRHLSPSQKRIMSHARKPLGNQVCSHSWQLMTRMRSPTKIQKWWRRKKKKKPVEDPELAQFGEKKKKSDKLAEDPELAQFGEKKKQKDNDKLKEDQ